MFGWSYPPGCSGTPNDETGSVALVVPNLPPNMAAWWTEDDDVGITESHAPTGEYDDGVHQYVVGTCGWNDDLTEEQNFAAATLVVVKYLNNVQ